MDDGNSEWDRESTERESFGCREEEEMGKRDGKFQGNKLGRLVEGNSIGRVVEVDSRIGNTRRQGGRRGRWNSAEGDDLRMNGKGGMQWWRCVDAGEGEAALGSGGGGARTAAAAQGQRRCLVGGGGCSNGDDDVGIWDRGKERWRRRRRARRRHVGVRRLTWQRHVGVWRRR